MVLRKFLSTSAYLAVIIMAGTITPAEGSQASDLESVFLNATTAVGEKYSAVRTRIVEAQGVEHFLTKNKNAAPSIRDQWLAQILQNRITDREEFQKLEQQFHEKVFRLYHAYPDRSQVPRMSAGYQEGLLIPGETSPFDKDPKKFEATWGSHAPQVREYWESLRVSDSALWKPFCGEILLKGWVPAGPVQDPPPSELTRGKDGPVTQVEYTCQAIILLGKLHDERAGPRLLELLQDKSTDPDVRTSAVMALGTMQYKSALASILEACESTDDAGWLQAAAFDAVVAMKDRSALPRLQQIIEQGKVAALQENDEQSKARALGQPVKKPGRVANAIKWRTATAQTAIHRLEELKQND